MKKNVFILLMLLSFSCSNNDLPGGDKYTPDPYIDTIVGLIDLTSIDTANGQLYYTLNWFNTLDTLEITPNNATKYIQHEAEFINPKNNLKLGIFKATKIEKGHYAGSRGPQKESTLFIVE